MNRPIPAWAQAIGGSAMAILLSGNLWFVVRLIHELDEAKSIVYQLRQDVAVLSARVDNLPKGCSFPATRKGDH